MIEFGHPAARLAWSFDAARPTMQRCTHRAPPPKIENLQVTKPGTVWTVVGLAGAVFVVYGPPRPPWTVGLLCWQRQCGAGRHGLNGSFQPRHTADLASISFPNGRG